MVPCVWRAAGSLATEGCPRNLLSFFLGKLCSPENLKVNTLGVFFFGVTKTLTQKTQFSESLFGVRVGALPKLYRSAYKLMFGVLIRSIGVVETAAKKGSPLRPGKGVSP